MCHVTIWHRLINIDALQNKKHCLVSGITTNEAVMSLSLQNGNSFSSHLRAADSLATGVHCNRVEALWNLWELTRRLTRPTQFAVFSVFHQLRGLLCKWSSPWSKLSRSKCKCYMCLWKIQVKCSKKTLLFTLKLKFKSLHLPSCSKRPGREI